MPDQNDFAARLARIQEKQGQQQGAKPRAEAPRLDGDGPRIPGDMPPDYGGGGGGGMGFVAKGMMLTLLVGVMGMGTLYVLNQKDKAGSLEVAGAQATVDKTTAAPGVSADAPAEVPKALAFKVKDKPRRALPSDTDERGWRYGPGDVATASGTTLPLAELVTGYDPARLVGPTGTLVTFTPNSDCTLRRPTAGEVVHNVRLEQGAGDSQLHLPTKEMIADATLQHIDALGSERNKYRIGTTAERNAGRVDVLVTDTSAPVYLVLQSMYDNTLWNVHRGPGVTIAHVAMIGNTPGLVAPEDVTFEALRISDFIDPAETDFLRFDPVLGSTGARNLESSNGTIRPCMIAPFRAPRDDWHATRREAEGLEQYIRQTTIVREGHVAFADWYEKTLGTDPNENLVEAEWAHHVLVGPRPDAPLGYQDVAGETVNILPVPAETLLFTSDADLIQAHRDLLIQAVGGDVSRLDPAPMEFASQ